MKMEYPLPDNNKQAFSTTGYLVEKFPAEIKDLKSEQKEECSYETGDLNERTNRKITYSLNLINYGNH